MLYLGHDTIKIKRAKREFHSAMLDFVFKRIDSIPKQKKINTSVVERFFNININPYLDDILIGEPDVLLKINKQVSPIIQSSKDIIKGIDYVFNYESFIRKTKRYDAYNLAESLDISTCPYCNRNYTNTVIRKRNKQKITRPQFDHYFDKDRNPLLAISFYNLIPSCSTCNSSIKGIRNMNSNDFLHPYIDNNTEDIVFTYKYSSNTKSGIEVKVLTPIPSKAKNSMDAFAIEEVYNSHTGELLDMLKTRQYFSDKYLSILASNLLKDVIISREDIYRIVFGVEYDTKKFLNRPFSKFKSDILKELEII